MPDEKFMKLFIAIQLISSFLPLATHKSELIQVGVVSLTPIPLAPLPRDFC